MNIKNEIMKNLDKIDVSYYDQSQGNYHNLLNLISLLMDAGFLTNEIEDIIYNILPIHCKDKCVKRWVKYRLKPNKKFYKNNKELLNSIFKLNVENFDTGKRSPAQIMEAKIYREKTKLLNSLYKTNVIKLKEYLEDNKTYIENEFLKFDNLNKVSTLYDFFKVMFPDEDFDDGIYLLAADRNFGKQTSFNDAIFKTDGQNYNINEYTHFILNRPYMRMKGDFEGICETDIFNSRYVLIECDEGLTLNEQILLGKLMVIKGLPVKMITSSGNKSAHIVLDFKIHKIEALRNLGLTSGLLNFSNYCNTSPKQYINGYTEEELTKFFKCINMNDYYKAKIQDIYDLIYSYGINVDTSGKNLNKWTRIPNGTRKDETGSYLQECIYLRGDFARPYDDTYDEMKHFFETIHTEFNKNYEALNEL